MRKIIVLIAIALMTVSAHARGAGGGKKQKQDPAKAEDQIKKKAAEDAYNNALKSIPASSKPADPWNAMR